MTPTAIVKIAVPMLALVAAGSAAFVLGFPRLQHEGKPEAAPVAAMTAPSQPAAGPRSENSPALAAAKPESTKTESTKTEAAKSDATPTEATKAEATKAEAAKTEVASTAAALGAPSPAPVTDQSVPAFDLARIEATGDAVIAGRAAPGVTVELLRNGDRLDQAVADASGQFVMVPPRLPAGSYELTLRAKLADGTLVSSKQGVPVTLKEVEATSSVAQSAAQSVRRSRLKRTCSPSRPRLLQSRRRLPLRSRRK